MTKKETRSIIRVLVLLLAIAIIVSGLTRFAFVIYQEYKTYDIKHINATFTISNTVGIAADNTMLNFGAVPQGRSTSTRQIELYHEYKDNLTVKIRARGSIAKIMLPVDDVVIEPFTERNITISVVSHGETGTTYNGTIDVIYLRP